MVVEATWCCIAGNEQQPLLLKQLLTLDCVLLQLRRQHVVTENGKTFDGGEHAIQPLMD